MVDRDYDMQTEDPAHYNIDENISVEMVKDNDCCFVAIYNDQNGSSVSFQVSRDKLRELADFFSRNLGRN
jgi:hypothetical protein